MAALNSNQLTIVNVVVRDGCFSESLKKGPVQLKFAPQKTIEEFSFLSFVNKIGQYFEVEPCRIGVMYWDDEDDLIKVSIEEEWQTAIENASVLEEDLNVLIYEPNTFTSVSYGDWMCLSCTFVNRNSADQCDMCLQGRISPQITLVSNAECAVSNSLVKLNDDADPEETTVQKFADNNGDDQENFRDSFNQPDADPPNLDHTTEDTCPPDLKEKDYKALQTGSNDKAIKLDSSISFADGDITRQSLLSSVNSGTAQYAPRHKNTQCSNCERDIFQIRYKCANCARFNLCSHCEASSVQLHDPTHVFVKLSVPLPERVSHKILITTNLYTGESVLENDEDSSHILLERITPGQNRNHKFRQLDDMSSQKSNSSLERSSVIDLYYNTDSMESKTQIDKLSSFDGSASQFSSGVFESDQPDYGFKVVKEMNFPHGFKVGINQIIKKSWIIENIGRQSWGINSIQLTAQPLLPECIKVDPVVFVPVCKSHRQIVLTVECQIIAPPPEGSSLTCHWFMSPSNDTTKTFGETLLLLVNTEAFTDKKNLSATSAPPPLPERRLSPKEKQGNVESCEEKMNQLTLETDETVFNEPPESTSNVHTETNHNEEIQETPQHSADFMEDKSSDETESFCVLSPDNEHEDADLEMNDTFENLARAAAQLELHTSQLVKNQSSESGDLPEQKTRDDKDVKLETEPAESKCRVPSSNSETDHSDFVIVEPSSLLTTANTNHASLATQNSNLLDSYENVDAESEPAEEVDKNETNSSPREENEEAPELPNHHLESETNTDESTKMEDNEPIKGNDSDLMTASSDQRAANALHQDVPPQVSDKTWWEQHPVKYPPAPSYAQWQPPVNQWQPTTKQWQPTPSQWQPPTAKWQPPKNSWTPDQMSRNLYQYESNTQMRQLIEMGFGNRPLNQQLLDRFDHNVEDVVAELIRMENSL